MQHNQKDQNQPEREAKSSSSLKHISITKTLTHGQAGKTSLSPLRLQHVPGCHLETWAPRSTEVWTQPGSTPSWWPRPHPISGWHRSSDTNNHFHILLFPSINTTMGDKINWPKCYRVQSSAWWGGTCVCRPEGQHRPSPWTWSIRFWVRLCRAAETHSYVYATFISMWLDIACVFKQRDLSELLVWVSEPRTGGGVGRITLFQHLVLWQARRRSPYR